MKRITKVVLNNENYDIYDKAAHDKIDNIELPDITGLATKDELNDAIDNIEIPEVDLSNYYNKTEVNNLLKECEVISVTLPATSGNVTNDDNIRGKIWQCVSKGKKLAIRFLNDENNFYVVDFTGGYNPMMMQNVVTFFASIRMKIDGNWVTKLGSFTVGGFDGSGSISVHYIDEDYYSKAEIDTKIPDTSNLATSEQLSTLTSRVDDIEDNAIDTAIIDTLQTNVNTNTQSIQTLSTTFTSYKNGFDENIQDLQTLTTQHTQDITNINSAISDLSSNIVVMTQAEYDAATKDANKIYYIVEEV